MPSIPSLPISWSEAQPLLQTLNGHGLASFTVNRTNWRGAISGVDYSTGPANDTIAELENVMYDDFRWINNALGIINGTNEDEVVIVGNHHDAWMIGGAGMLIRAKVFGLASNCNSGSTFWISDLDRTRKSFRRVAQNWLEAEKNNCASQLGCGGVRLSRKAGQSIQDVRTLLKYSRSTEWVEEFVPWLKDSVVSYLNIDVGVAGTIPDFSATPDLHKLTTSIAKKIAWPHVRGQTLYDAWVKKSGEIGALGAQSDYTAFVHRAGVSAIDLGTTRAPLDPIYHTHSNYDSFHWMTKFADPGFLTHKAVGQYLTLMLYHLVDDPLLPLEPENYGTEMRAYLAELKGTISSVKAATILDVSQLEDAIAEFDVSALHFKNVRDSAPPTDHALVASLNSKARRFSRGFIGEGGLPGREFYQHLIFAPGVDSGYAPVTFPGIAEAALASNLTLAAEYVVKTSRAILAAADVLDF